MEQALERTDLIVVVRRKLGVVLRHIGDFDLWLREEPHEHDCDLNVVTPILTNDEYELSAIHAGAPGAVRSIVDVGAHIGSFTIRAKRLWPDATVVAIEPDPQSAAVFRRNTEGLSNVHLHEVAALGCGVSWAHLCEVGRDGKDGNCAASYVREALGSLPGAIIEGAGPTAVVRAAAISDVLADEGLEHIDVLKLDCEGAEADILEDLKCTGWLGRTRWIRGEWHHWETIPRVEACLHETHIYHICRHEYPWGYFLAHRRE